MLSLVVEFEGKLELVSSMICLYNKGKLTIQTTIKKFSLTNQVKKRETSRAFMTAGTETHTAMLAHTHITHILRMGVSF